MFRAKACFPNLQRAQEQRLGRAVLSQLRKLNSQVVEVGGCHGVLRAKTLLRDLDGPLQQRSSFDVFPLIAV